MLGQHVSGKTVGIIGMGRIGKAIARRCHFGFGMEVIYANRSEKTLDFSAQQLPMDQVAARADFLVVAAPATPETYHLVNADMLGHMQPHAHLINIARGDLVDETALIASLEQGQIAGAGLDVYEFEPEVPAALKALDNVTLLPHLGTATLEVRQAMGQMAVDNLECFFAGQAVPNPV